MSALNPEPTVLVKLGSMLVHVEEMLSHGNHPFDRIAYLQLAGDPEVTAWMKEMDTLALLPKKRT